MTTNKQKRAEGPRCPACENEKISCNRTFVPSFLRDISCGHNNSARNSAMEVMDKKCIENILMVTKGGWGKGRNKLGVGD